MADSVVVYEVICIAVACSLLTVMVIPAPSRAPDNEAYAYQALLGLGCLATIAMGMLALVDRVAESAICGAVAWLLVMPCVWLLRAPAGAEEWGEEDEDDDDGGSSWPRRPSAPPAPDDRLPGLGPSGLAGGRVAWAPARAVSPEPEPAASMAPAAHAACEPAAATARRRVRAPARRVRGDHRSIVHVRAVVPHAGRRRRSASLHRRVLRRCRRWLWPEPPECIGPVPFEPLAHDGRRHSPRLEHERLLTDPRSR